MTEINTTKKTRYWIYSPGPRARKWDAFYHRGIMAIGWDEIGDLSQYKSKEETRTALQKAHDSTGSYMNDSLATWQFACDMKPGDIVYAKKGNYTIVGRGIVDSDYIYDPSDPYYPNTRKVNWTHEGDFPHPGEAVTKTLTEITFYPDYVAKLEALFTDIEPNTPINTNTYDEYNKSKFLTDVYLDEEKYDELRRLLEYKKNIILTGAPGVGKTYIAEKLAYSIIEKIDDSRICKVQFHQSFSYEDFIMGYRPNGENGSFKLKKSDFYNLCKSAAKDPQNKYYLIIDEINRGNVSRIFGELFSLIESDKRKRECAMKLMYAPEDDEDFYIPENVYIIGTMNTADRSLALIDYALRRRFAFFEMTPDLKQANFVDFYKKLNNSRLDKLIDKIIELNDIIAKDPILGDGFCIGYSYFCNLKPEDDIDARLHSIVNYELIPQLKEYWFDDKTKYDEWSKKLRDAIAVDKDPEKAES